MRRRDVGLEPKEIFRAPIIRKGSDSTTNTTADNVIVVQSKIEQQYESKKKKADI